MSSRTSPDRSRRGAHSIGGPERRKRGGWLKWLLLGLLALALIGGLIALLTGGDDSKSSAKAGATATAAAPATPAAPADTAAAAPAGAAGTAGTAGGSLTAGGADLLGAQGADIASKVGQDATGTGVTVQSVTSGGFFVGTSATDRRFVEYGGDVGADEPAQAYKPKVGDKVDLTGPVKKAPQDPGQTLKLDGADAALVAQQGAYVNADTVKPAA